MQNFDAHTKSRKKFIESTKPQIDERYGFLFLALVVLYFGGHLAYAYFNQ